MSPDSPSSDLIRIGETVCTDPSSGLLVLYTVRFEGHPVLPYVTGRPPWVVVPVKGAKLLGGDVTMLQDMVNHCARALGRHLLAQSEDAGGDFAIRHVSTVPYVATLIEEFTVE